MRRMIAWIAEYSEKEESAGRTAEVRRVPALGRDSEGPRWEGTCGASHCCASRRKEESRSMDQGSMKDTDL